MTVTESTATSLQGLLGTVGEAMTGEVVVLQADTPAGPFHRHEHRLTGYRVHELMTAEPVIAGVDSPLAEAVLSMDQAGINRLPVVDAGGRPVGILTRDDVLRVLARRIRELGRPEGGRPGMESD